MDEGQLPAFREVVNRVRQGPHPQGEEFELCREVLAAAPASSEAAQALRVLLEGAMADARTSIADAQIIMRLLKALDRGEVEPADLVR